MTATRTSIRTTIAWCVLLTALFVAAAIHYEQAVDRQHRDRCRTQVVAEPGCPR